MFRLICSGWAIVLLVSGCSMEGTPTRHNDFVPLTSIEIIAATPAIALHTSTRLTVIGNFSGQFSRDITAQAAWSSSSPSVAGFVTPDSPNRVTGHLPGTAILTATVGSIAAPFTMTVTPATIAALTISPAAPAIPQGLSSQLAVSGTFSDASTQDLTFDASWVSSAPAVATVSDAADSKGLARALKVGTTTITATFDGVSGSTLLTVSAAALQAITVSPANPTILSQSGRSFQATGLYSDGSTADITGLAAWSSSQPDIATITSGGQAKTVVPGTTAISASLNGVSGGSNLKVTGGNLTEIALSPLNFRLVKDTLTPMTATGFFSNGSSRDITGVVDWSVASSAIANVTFPEANQAVLSALAVTAPATPAIVKAQSGLVTAATNLTVTAPLLQTIAISPAGLDLIAGTSDRLTLIAAFQDGSTQDVTANADWTSDLDATVSVDNTGLAKGRVRGVAASSGSVNINAAFGGLTVTAPATVKARTLVSLAISGAAAVAVGNQVRYTAVATYADASTRNVTADATWSTDKPNTASMVDNTNQPGQLVAVDNGTTTLTASFGDKTETVNLTIQ